jgi:hypothetical protein
MSSTTVLDLPVTIKGDSVFVDGELRCFNRYVVEIPTGGDPVIVWFQENPTPNASAQAVLCARQQAPVLFELNSGAVQMFTRLSKHTVVQWMCRAAGIDL